jgi:hypothetical protein
MAHLSCTRAFLIPCCLLVLTVLPGCGGSDGDTGVPAAARDRPGETGGATPVGRIDATVAGEARSWNVLHLQREDGLKSTGIYRSRSIGRNTAHSITLGGHVGTSITSPGSLHIIINTIQPLDRCPCTLDGQSIEYWAQRPVQRYEGKSVVTLDRFEANADGTYSASGSFAGTLPLITNGSGTPHPDESVSVDGTFDVARILVRGAGP